MLTVSIILIIAALIAALLSVTTPPRVPLWVAVILLCVVVALQVLPK